MEGASPLAPREGCDGAQFSKGMKQIRRGPQRNETALAAGGGRVAMVQGQKLEGTSGGRACSDTSLAKRFSADSIT